MTAASPQPPEPAAGSGSGGGEQQQRQQEQLVARLLDHGRHSDALAALQPLLAQRPDAPTLLCMQGRCHGAAGNRPQVHSDLVVRLC